MSEWNVDGTEFMDGVRLRCTEGRDRGKSAVFREFRDSDMRHIKDHLQWPGDMGYYYMKFLFVKENGSLRPFIKKKP